MGKGSRVEQNYARVTANVLEVLRGLEVLLVLLGRALIAEGDLQWAVSFETDCGGEENVQETWSRGDGKEWIRSEARWRR